MASLEDNFNEQTENPAHKYSGYEGYERGLAETMDSFYDAFPDYRGHVALIDLKALEDDRAGELARLSKELGASDVEAMIKLVSNEGKESGHMFSGVNDVGDKIAAVAAWPAHEYDPAVLTFEQNFSLVDGAVHELAHAIDYMEGSIDPDTLFLRENYVESYADSYRIALSILHGHQGDDLKEFIFSAGYSQITRAVDIYDNGVALAETYLATQRAAIDMGINEPSQDFYFEHWKIAKEVADTVRSHNMERHGRPEASYNQITRWAIARTAESLIDDGVAEKAPHLDVQESENSERAVSRYLDTLDVQAYEAGELTDVDADTMLQMDIAYDVRQQVNAWMEERKDYIPDAGRLLAAYDYVVGKGDPLDYQIPEYDPLSFFGKSMDMYLAQGDDYDLVISSRVMEIVREMPEHEGTILAEKSHSELIDFFTENPEATKALADGMTLNAALSTVQNALPPSDELQNESTGLTF